MSKQEQRRDWLTENLKDPGFRRSFECEMLAEAVIVPLEQAKDKGRLSGRELSAKSGVGPTRLLELFADPARMTLAEASDLALALGLRVVVSIRPLDDNELKIATVEDGIAVTVS